GIWNLESGIQIQEVPMSNWKKKYVEMDMIIREKRPMIHHITNYVVMNVTANVTLAMGASPVMAHANEEVEDMVVFASAHVLNPGTLSPHWITAMLKSGKKAKELGIPIILDPVGAGATSLRTDTCMQILEEVRPDVIRGNQAEVMILGGEDAQIQGVDSLETGEAPVEAFKALARKTGAVICVTGPIDHVTDGETTFRIENGHSMMGNVTGTGCSASTAVAVYCAAGGATAEACAMGLAVFGACGELAGEECRGPGSFQVAILDALYNAPSRNLGKRLRISEVS
ncbi:MAG TPA: hydroxyethylthiazole kinase, partial [Nitrospiria bacterium]|nr:hydroxyethylthiazole kinase [Nitrospiria bacterium]